MAPPIVSRDQAVQELVNHNDRIVSAPSNIEAEAIDRLLSALKKAKAANTASKVEKIVKLVKDLDIVFFGGVLWGHIQVSWGGPAAFRCAKGKVILGISRYAGFSLNQCEIRLNREFILNNPNPWKSFKRAWATLLHEMSHTLTMVRCRRNNFDNHNAHFRTTLHAVHRHSIERFEMRAISKHEDAYKHNHFMSDHWASDDPGGNNNVDTNPTEYYDNDLTTEELRATSHRRRGRNDNAGTETSYRDGDRSQDRHVQSALGTKKHDAGSRPKKKKHSSKEHSKTRDNGHRKHYDTDDTIRAKYPNGALVQRRGEPTCAIL